MLNVTFCAVFPFTRWSKKAETGVLHGGDPPKLVSADLTGARRLTLIVGDAGDGITHDHADWAGALLKLAPTEKDALGTEVVGAGLFDEFWKFRK